MARTPQVRNIALALILGLGRSGTSTFSRALRTMGVDLGDNLTPPEIGVNDKGFWEDEDFLSLNRDMLSFLGMDWYHLSQTPISAELVKRLRNNGFLDRATNLLLSKTTNASIFGFKDGRTTKLLPFWATAFERCGLYEVKYLIALRNPLSVAKSYNKYMGIEPARIYLLWPGYMISALKYSFGKRRVLSDYDRLLRSPRDELKRIASRLALTIDADDLHDFVDDFLDRKLRNSLHTDRALAKSRDVPPLVKEVYHTLLAAASDEIDLEDDGFQTILSAWEAEYNRLAVPLQLIDKLACEKHDAETRRQERLHRFLEPGLSAGRMDGTEIDKRAPSIRRRRGRAAPRG